MSSQRTATLAVGLVVGLLLPQCRPPEPEPTSPVSVSVMVMGPGAGRVRIEPSGTECSDACTLTANVGDALTFEAVAASGSRFEAWSGGCMGVGECTLTITGAATVTAQFMLKDIEVRQVLTVSAQGTGAGDITSSPAGIHCGQMCTAEFAEATVVVLTPVARSDSTFGGWAGACTGLGDCAVTMSENKAVSATFHRATEQSRVLTVQVGGAGQGRVTSAPAGIDCGSDCSETIANGTLVTLTATPSTNSRFEGWSGACTGSGACVVTLTSDQTVSATFLPMTTGTLHRLTVQKFSNVGSAGGAVLSVPAGVNCGTTCTADFTSGTMVQLTATPDANSTFGAWGGACSGTGPQCTVNMNAARNVTAIFSQRQHFLHVTVAGSGTGRVTSSPNVVTCTASVCNAFLTAGTMVTLTATATGSSTFAGWSGACTGTTGTCVVTMSDTQDVTARFNPL